MEPDVKYVDVDDMPELLSIIEEVRSSGQPSVLRSNGEDLAVLMPAKPARRRRSRREKTKEDYEAFLRSAGGWKGLVDTDRFIEDNRESRRISSRPPVEL